MVKKLKDNFFNLQTLVEEKEGVSMFVVSRYDGNGNSRIYFAIRFKNNETTYEKFDSAAEAFNMQTRQDIWK